jgi:Ca-activated chloride channel homolog
MSFMWTELLWLLLLVPALAAAYVLAQKRRQKYALRYASLSLVKQALGAGPGFRRHVPPILFLAAMSLLITGLARPTATVMLPSHKGTIILAMDSSGSMRADDVKPSRMEASKAAAKAFIEKQPGGSRIGVVAFAATASLVQPPTREREPLLAAIDRLNMQRGTAIGNGILTSLNAILEDFGEKTIAIHPSDEAVQEAPRDATKPMAGSIGGETAFAPAIVVLLSDGQSNTGPPPLEVVAHAAARGIRIYTVGLGSVEGTVLSYYNRSFRVRLDEETLKAIAEKTGAAYFKADSETDLREIYEKLGGLLVLKPEKTEITALFAAAAALLMLAAGALSLMWFNRLP